MKKTFVIILLFITACGLNVKKDESTIITDNETKTSDTLKSVDLTSFGFTILLPVGWLTNENTHGLRGVISNKPVLESNRIKPQIDFGRWAIKELLDVEINKDIKAWQNFDSSVKIISSKNITISGIEGKNYKFKFSTDGKFTAIKDMNYFIHNNELWYLAFIFNEDEYKGHSPMINEIEKSFKFYK